MIISRVYLIKTNLFVVLKRFKILKKIKKHVCLWFFGKRNFTELICCFFANIDLNIQLL
ncbi:hypothetical protein LMANV2_300014 [Leptospira interrogans serovar Manilae]|uniref:Uncharacterized protein n=1 Tax=Leptospira interrogans serovar Manilae TaxID=214675 RepID=A0AAQ1NY90_LEPIR|nr:hypothetical protein LMANV2_300014 [Leptospira interrogans serovar Manilae]